MLYKFFEMNLEEDLFFLEDILNEMNEMKSYR